MNRMRKSTRLNKINSLPNELRRIISEAEEYMESSINWANIMLHQGEITQDQNDTFRALLQNAFKQGVAINEGEATLDTKEPE